MSDSEDPALLERAEKGIASYLKDQRDQGRITGSYYQDAVTKTVPNLRKWLLAGELDRISPNLRNTLREAIRAEQWEALTNAYSRNVAFGTGGIREKMGPDRDVILRLKREGIHAPIVKGPNTINDVVYLLTSAGVAKYGLQRTPPLTKVVIGYDSRIRGQDFARLIAGLFLAHDYTVYLFDEACMYPSVTYAVPTLKADIGVFISASHNDLRYNGYKLSCGNGSQFDPEERYQLYNDYIAKVRFDDIRTLPLDAAPREKLWFLGGVRSKKRRVIQEGEHAGMPLADPLPEARDLYVGREDRIIDLHTMHVEHVKTFLLCGEAIAQVSRPLSIGYAAFNGSGRKAVPRLLAEAGFRNVRRIMKLDPLDGTFPAFCSDPGKEQQPDPGDWRAADIAVEAFKEEYPAEWDSVDLIIGTDPDADRCGVIVKLPEHQRAAYPHPGTGELRDYTLLSADEVWPLILWYRLTHEVEKFGKVRDAEKKFITLSHTTTDLLARIARKFGLGVLKTWVGFAQLAAGTRVIWDLHRSRDTEGMTKGGKLPPYDEGRRNPDDKVCNRTIHSWEAMDDHRRSVNVAALEQSNGFSILGAPPPDERSLGAGGHVRDKDGAFAAVLVAELAQYAKERHKNLLDLLDEEVYLDPDVGLYVTHYEPDPLDGEYEGLAGYTKKRSILNRTEELSRGLPPARPSKNDGTESAPAEARGSVGSCDTAPAEARGSVGSCDTAPAEARGSVGSCDTARAEARGSVGSCDTARAEARGSGDLELGGLKVKSTVVYRTGKYDAINWPGFPDEGYRFYFDDRRRSHLTVRPSGTSNALRFHVQLYGGSAFGGSKDELIARKAELRAAAIRIVDDIRERIGAPR